MLTGDLVRPRLRARDGRLIIRWIEANRYGKTAAALIRLFRDHIDQPVHAWEAALEAYEGDRVDYIVVRGLAKVLMDAATVEPVPMPISPAELRVHLFSTGPAFAQADLFYPHTRADRLEAVAAETGIPIDQIEALLYADRPSAYILVDAGPDWTAESLIARYNLELARAALYYADHMRVQIYDTFKDFWRYLKLFRLMFWAVPHGEGYDVLLDGPISPFVQSTTRYGRQFAAFLPALLLCERWQMQSEVRPPGLGEWLAYTLDPSAALTGHFRGSGAFDSQMEADFAAEFQARFGDQRGKWTLTREDEVILLVDTVMIPDFALTHRDDGTRILIEIVGFWHPEYLRRKLAKVREADRHDLLLLVYEGVNLSDERLADVPAEVLYFKNKPVLKDVLAAAERMR